MIRDGPQLHWLARAEHALLHNLCAVSTTDPTLQTATPYIQLADLGIWPCQVRLLLRATVDYASYQQSFEFGSEEGGSCRSANTSGTNSFVRSIADRAF